MLEFPLLSCGGPFFTHFPLFSGLITVLRFCFFTQVSLDYTPIGTGYFTDIIFPMRKILGPYTRLSALELKSNWSEILPVTQVHL